MATIASAGADCSEATAARAAPAPKRIEALDFVRGVALCGILLMNITGFGLPDAYTNPVNAGGATGTNLVGLDRSPRSASKAPSARSSRCCSGRA